MSDRHVCPWWLAYTFDNPLRRFIHNPGKMLGGFVAEGMTVVDIGCGMGYFSLGLADMVGDSGRVISVDMQQKMLDIMQKRAVRAGVSNRIEAIRCKADKIGVDEQVDFVLAFWMVHEVPDPEFFFKEIAAILKPSGKMVYTEPLFHVNDRRYQNILAAAHDSGLKKSKDLDVAFSRAALLTLQGTHQYA